MGLLFTNGGLHLTQYYVPLAEKLRPTTVDDIVGQEHITGNKGLLSLSIREKRPLSVLFWGPPGCGKTTLAQAYAKSFEAKFLPISAVTSGVAELRRVIAEIESKPLFHSQAFLFIDEIHRYNKTQQDLILPYLEKGTFLLLGATTENPSFSLNNALLSRLRVLTLKPLEKESLEKILKKHEVIYGPLSLTEEARTTLIGLANGDGRYLLNMVESLGSLDKKTVLSKSALCQLLQKRSALFDKSGDGHYNLISALHKSIRGSDPDAALYWFHRILNGGEDPLFLARRLIRIASEDIGLADPQALQLTIAARDAYKMLGTPEGELALGQAVVYLALAPKSNALYLAFKKAKAFAEETNNSTPPPHILNAPTKLMKESGYGEGYLYDHDTPEGFSGQNYFPEDTKAQHFYNPVARGFERDMQKRLAYFAHIKTLKNN